MYRHFEWDPLAQLSPSIDIYREQSALPRWPDFEIDRDRSTPKTAVNVIDARACRSSSTPRVAGIEHVNSLS
jgi:hypothetical protein